MQKKWVLQHAPDTGLVKQLSSAINVNQNLAAILINRGVDSFDKAKAYFRPQLEHLHDPMLMQDMGKAVERLVMAMDQQQKILVYGDYDVDGTTAVALLYDFLKSFYDQVEYYVPDRYKEGYGLSAQAVEWAHQHEFKLIITLDCGIKAVDLVATGVQQGIDFIICDHHLPGDELPAAVAVLDPKRSDDHYPYKELSGCGVGFKLVQALNSHLGLPNDKIYGYLDLVAVSIAADLVPITGENRVLTHYGLRILNKNPRAGLAALIEVSQIRNRVGIHEIVFGVAPRINAAGRIDHAKAAVELLLSSEIQQAAPRAKKVNEKNTTRKQYDSDITQQALTMIEEESLDDHKSTVLFKEDWHKGVIGIVASRCIEKYYRPTVILTESQDKATGSARSVEGFDIYEAIAACSDLLEAYGGHKYAAGLTLPVDKVPQFQQRFEEVVSASITPEMLVPRLKIDQELTIEDLNDKFYNILKQMGPFGPGNPSPIFASYNLKAHSQVQILKNEHLKFKVRSTGGRYFDGVAFGLAKYADEINKGVTFDVAYSLELNEFRGERSLQMMVKDIKLKS